MKKTIHLTVASLGLLSASLLSPLTQAETINYHCTYTHASYTAPFMKTPGTRNCPEGRCSYNVAINGTQGSINGVSGFDVFQSESQIVLGRTARDPIMGGMDTATLTIQKSDMSFVGVKETTPSVVLTTKGSCTQ